MSQIECIVRCPHCGLVSEIEEINCGIFRCGYYIDTLLQIPPHLPQAECERLVQRKEIYGCSKPWRFVNGLVMGCDYQ